MSARIFIDHKNIQMIIEPYRQCSERLRSTIKNSYNLSWEKRKKIFRGKSVEKFYIIGKYRDEVEFNWILDVIEREFEICNIDSHDYYEGYLAVEPWLLKRQNK